MNETKQLMEMEISYNPSKIPIQQNLSINSSITAYQVLQGMFNWNTISCQEEFLVLFLNRANHVLGVQKLSKGGLNSTVVDKRLLFASALKSLSSSLILAHNHPSGNLLPSNQDLKLTHSILEAGKLFDICILDHLIIGTNTGEYYSMKDEGDI